MGGAVLRPEDLAKGNRRIIENALNDINPDMKGRVIDLLSSWRGAASEQKLKEMIGQERAGTLLDRVQMKRKPSKGCDKDAHTYNFVCCTFHAAVLRCFRNALECN